MKYYTLAKLIKFSRIEAGLTQKQLAEKLCIHIQQVSNFERGYCKIPADKFRRACTILKIAKQVVYNAMLVDEEFNFSNTFNKMWNP